MSMIGQPRPLIDINEEKIITYNGVKCNVSMSRKMLHVAGTDVAPAALCFLYQEYKRYYGEEQTLIKLQEVSCEEAKP